MNAEKHTLKTTKFDYRIKFYLVTKHIHNVMADISAKQYDISCVNGFNDVQLWAEMHTVVLLSLYLTFGKCEDYPQVIFYITAIRFKAQFIQNSQTQD